MAAQNQKSYFENMNEDYIQKHYPEGSIFKAYQKTVKGARSIFVLFMMGIFMTASIAGFIWSVNRTLEIIRDEEENMLGMGIGISVFLLLLILGIGAIIFVIMKDRRKNADDWIRIFAKAGGCSEQEMREFDRQALEPDSLILNHLGKVKSFTTGQKNGILTRDYICLYGGSNPNVLKLDALTGAYIKDNTYYVKVGNTRKQAHYLTIEITNKDKKRAWAETSKESAQALQALLKSRCPGLDTADGAVLPG